MLSPSHVVFTNQHILAASWTHTGEVCLSPTLRRDHLLPLDKICFPFWFALRVVVELRQTKSWASLILHSAFNHR